MASLKPNPVFQAVGAAQGVGYTPFDLSHTWLGDADLGRVFPVLFEETLPGDVWDLNASFVIRAQPMVTPVFHRIDATLLWFYSRDRDLFKDWEKFITGGPSGDDTTSLPTIFAQSIADNSQVDLRRYGLWDYLGLPMHNTGTGAPANTMQLSSNPPVIDFAWRMYWQIWRDFFRDENVQLTYPDGSTEVGQDFADMQDNLSDFLDSYDTIAGPLYYPFCDTLFYVGFQKGYFESALPTQQRGAAPTIPISGSTSAEWDTSDFVNGTPTRTLGVSPLASTSGFIVDNSAPGEAINNAVASFNDNTVSFTATGVDITDLRYAVQVQRWMERNMRGGYRYTEQLMSHWGVVVHDGDVNKPILIGGVNAPVIISEVLQTSESGLTAQGTMAGHGMSLGEGKGQRFRTKEHGYIMGLMFMRPEAIYQQGIRKTFSHETRWDYPSPEFMHLSEEPIAKREIFFSDSATDDQVFGYQSAWDAYRFRHSLVTGRMASDLDYWHLSRQFSSAPSLNETFLTTEQLSKNRRDAWAVDDVENNGYGEFMVKIDHYNKVLRHMPFISEPGLLDHI